MFFLSFQLDLDLSSDLDLRLAMDENAMNEALEARLAEVIARTAPSDSPVDVSVGFRRVRIPSDPDEHLYQQIEEEDPDFLAVLPRTSSMCQEAEAQQQRKKA